jgi:predicted DNA-binding transcriptional regulator YafY
MADSEQLIRQWTFLRTLSARRLGVSIDEFARETGYSARTIRRDLNLLKRLGFAIDEEKGPFGRKRWRMNGADGLVNLQFTLEEAAALYLGRQFLEPLAGTLFHSGAQSAFAKIRATLGDAALRHLEKLAGGFYHAARGWSDYSRKAELIDDLMRGIEDRRMTSILYRSLSSTEPVSQYDLYPLALIYWRGALYLIADSPTHGEIRTFKVDRIDSAQVLELRFAETVDFDAARFLEHSFGIFQKDGEPIRVRVAFRPQVARLLEERQFHPSQKLTRRRDGRVVAEFRLIAHEELTSWILGWGPLAEVLEPAELREQIAQAHLEAADVYADLTSPLRSENTGQRPKASQK